MKKIFANKLALLKNLISIIKDKNDPFIISGGNTIKEIFKYLDQKIINTILLSDERMVNLNSNLRNDKFFKELIKKKLIKKEKFIHYNQSLLNNSKLLDLNRRIEGTKFKFAILSLGTNGHIASIFKKKIELSNYYFIDDAFKFPKKRLTVSLEKLKECKTIYLIASIKKKNKEIRNLNKNKLINYIGLKKVKLFIFH